VRHIEAAFDVNTRIIFAHPGVDVLDIEGHRFAQPRNLFLESRHGRPQEGLKQAVIKGMQVLTQPVLTGDGLLEIKAVGLGWVQLQAKAQFDD